MGVEIELSRSKANAITGNKTVNGMHGEQFGEDLHVVMNPGNAIPAAILLSNGKAFASCEWLRDGLLRCFDDKAMSFLQQSKKMGSSSFIV